MNNGQYFAEKNSSLKSDQSKIGHFYFHYFMVLERTFFLVSKVTKGIHQLLEFNDKINISALHNQKQRSKIFVFASFICET